MSRTAYLGPPGTFTQRAAEALGPGDELVPMVTPAAVIAAVAAGELDAGVVPFENSIEGEIAASLDALAEVAPEILIVGEQIIRVSFTLYRLPDDRSPLMGVVSHPAALTQCARYLRQVGVSTEASSSTAAACAQIAEGALTGMGALAAPGAGELYGLVPALTEVEDVRGALTRFVRVGREAPPQTGRDRTAFIIQPPQDQPGGLVEILQNFSLRGVNLTAITSRPARDALGNYWFYLECEGHIADDDLRAITMSLLSAGETIRFLGAFPEDPSRPEPARPRAYGEAYRAYRAMVDRVTGSSGDPDQPLP
ncbi:MAG TPA: prephenate dehydratase [Miltoncostaeaceae bacterium]|nr:prephenate dehydratase [Miltoncostaeaceae bacterium]